MFAASGVSTLLLGAGAIATAALAGVIGRAGMVTLSKRQTDKRDTASIYERLYGKPANPRTNEPATIGWTTQVENRLTSQDRVLSEIKADVKNLGTTVDQAAKAAADEVLKQITERDRVQKRDLEK